MGQDAPDTTDWRALARKDLAGIHTTIERNHPGAVDAQNPGFRSWLENGYTYARIYARRVASRAGYRHVLKYYVYGFQDGHMTLNFKASPPVSRWPGFLVSYDGGDFVVAPRPETVSPESDSFAEARPPVGAVLVSCDGRPASDWADRVLRRFHPLWSVSGARPEAAPHLFIDRGNPFVDRPGRCVFSYRAGEERSYSLRWRTIAPDRLAPFLQAAQQKRDAEVGLREFGEGGYWISLPTFNALHDPSSAALHRLVERVQARAPLLRRAPAVVFDVRGNSGGATAFGLHLAALLWGPEAVNRAMPQVASVDWRASETNLTYMREVTTVLEDRFGPNSDMVEWWTDVQSGMEQSLESGQPWYRETPAAPVRADTAFTADVTADVFLLTDGRCFSACLEFADVLRALPGVTHVGRETSADTPYMEAVNVELPSERALFGYPIKVYRGRRRDANETYRPTPPYRWTGSIGNTAALERWIWELATQENRTKTGEAGGS